MKYNSIQQSMLAVLLVFALGATTMQAASERLPVNHGNSAEEIKRELSCDDAFAKEVRHLLVNFDNAIFSFLHYTGNKQSYLWHVSQFDSQLKALKCSIAKAKAAGHTKASQTLEKVLKNLTELRSHIYNAKDQKGLLAAVSLGKNLDPLIKDFNTYFPSLSLTVEAELKRAYRYEVITRTVYVEHLKERLAIK